jgi:hypothetical protein
MEEREFTKLHYLTFIMFGVMCLIYSGEVENLEVNSFSNEGYAQSVALGVCLYSFFYFCVFGYPIWVQRIYALCGTIFIPFCAFSVGFDYYPYECMTYYLKYAFIASIVLFFLQIGIGVVMDKNKQIDSYGGFCLFAILTGLAPYFLMMIVGAIGNYIDPY